MSDQSSKYAAGASTAAAIMSALALLEARKKEGAPGEGVIPDEVIALIAAIAATSDSINAELAHIHDVLAGLQITFKGWPSNTKRFATITLNCAVANQAYNPPQLYVPDGMALLIRSHPINAAGSLVRVAASPTEAVTPDASYPLQPSEAVAYYIKGAHEVYVSSTVAGSIVIFSAEQE